MYDLMSSLVYYGTRKKALAWIMSVGFTFLMFAYKFSGRNNIEIFEQIGYHESTSPLPSKFSSTKIALSLFGHKTTELDESSVEAIHKTSTVSLQQNRNFIKKTDFDINGTDVIVFLHIQKTGGSTFGRHLVRHLELKKRCVKRKKTGKFFWCKRPTDNTNWLFSRLSTGWPCGVHPDWTTLTECVHTQFKPLHDGERKFFYITFIREPLARYLSEWKHVARGATWDLAFLMCLGEDYEYPACWEGDNWEGVTLDEFMNCSDNLAHNRQTRMLANLREINCTGKSMDPMERDRVLLESAKRNLEDMAFFGVTERQRETQILFETLFNFRFKQDFFQFNTTYASEIVLADDQRERMKELNYLDVELYKFALDLFEARYAAVTSS